MENTDYTISKIKVCLKWVMLTSIKQIPLEDVSIAHFRQTLGKLLH